MRITRKLLWLLAGILLASPCLAAYTPGQTPPAPTAISQHLVSTAYGSGFRWTPVTFNGVSLGTANQTVHMNSGATAFTTDSGLLNNGTNVSIGGALDTSSALALLPQTASENGLAVTMPVSATGNAFQVKNSVGTVVFSISNLGNIGGPFITGNGLINSVNSYGGPSNNAIRMDGFTAPFTADVQAGNATGVSTWGVLGLRQWGSYSGDLLAARTYVGTNVFRFTNGGGLTNPGYHTITTVPTPAAPTITQAGTAGTTTYGYRVSAISGTGETIASTETTTATGNATLSGTNYNIVSWTPTAGAESYKVYGRTAGAELLIAGTTGAVYNTALCSYNDTGAITPAGALPLANSTGYLTVPSLTATGAVTCGSVVSGGVTLPTVSSLVIYIPGALAVAADAMEIPIPSFFTSRTLKRVTSRLGTPSTSGSVTYTIQLNTGNTVFTAASTSDTITIAASTYSPSDVTSFTSGITASTGNSIRINITAIGTGSKDLTVKLEF